MFIGHIAVGLAGKRIAPSVSLATWLASVQLVDMLWPMFLLAGLEHVRIAPGITPFTPLDFTTIRSRTAWSAASLGGTLCSRVVESTAGSARRRMARGRRAQPLGDAT